MNFGDRDDILKMAKKRLDEVKRIHRKASLIIPESVRVIFLVKDDPEKYHRFASREIEAGLTRRMALRRVLDPLARAVRS
jgi:formate dehydrogenase iron-sulfur subunit